MKEEKITGWAKELKGYNMPNMKQFQPGQKLIVISVIGGFVIGLGAGYALWKYPEYLLLETVPRIESPASTGQPDHKSANNADYNELLAWLELLHIRHFIPLEFYRPSGNLLLL